MRNSKHISTLTLITMMLTTVSIILSFGLSQRANAEAVPLIPIDTGNHEIDKKVSNFYDCIEEAVKTNKHSDLPHYFKSEPTKHQVTICYYNTFDNKDGNNNIDQKHTTDDESNRGDD